MPRPEEPPVVALLREKVGESRVVRWARRHKTPAAVLGGLLVTLKAYRWLLPWLLDLILNPREGIAEVREHWELLAAASGLVFVVGFVAVRFGLDWLDRLAAARERLVAVDDGEEKLIAPGPAWLERDELPPRMQIPPRLG